MRKSGYAGRRRVHGSTRGRHHAEFPSPEDPISRDPDGAISRYKEWVEHRYDPGYYLGGRLPPLIRALQGETPGAEMYGAVLIAFGLGSIFWAAATVWEAGLDRSGAFVTSVFTILLGVLMLGAGVTAVRRARRRRRAPK